MKDRIGQDAQSVLSIDNDLTIDFRTLYLTIKNRKDLLLIITTFFIAVMLIFLLITTPIYKSESIIKVNVKGDKVVDIDSVVSNISADDSAIQSELDILNSRYIAGKVVDKLNLVRDQEFNSDYGKDKSGGLFFGGKDLSNAEIAEEKRMERFSVVDKFLENLNVSKKPRSYTITIQFKSEDPKKAALIANTVVSEYLIRQSSVKFDVAKHANDWLNDRIAIMQGQLSKSELAVEIFREKNNLVEASGFTLGEQQLSELSTQLILAKTASTQAKARLHSAENSIDSSLEVLNSTLIQNLREQEAEVLRKKSDLSNRYGKKHPKMINVHAELRDLRAKIKDEIAKIKKGLKQEVVIAKIREDSIKDIIKSAQGRDGSFSKAKVMLDELKRQRDTDRTLYESFLLRTKEISQNKDLKQVDARVISVAEAPLKAHYPKKILMMLISIIIGGGVGVVVIFIMESLDDVLKSTDQLEQTTSLPSIGIVPEIDQDADIIKYIHNKPSSVFVESLKSALISINFSNPDSLPKSILITSSIPNEGKTTFAISLAAMSVRSGKKVLLIDCDLKKNSIAKKFGVEMVKNSLAEYLTGQVAEEEIINKDKNSGIHFISSKGNISNSQDLLSSNRMKDFIDAMSKKYDLVILDSPPLMPVSDSVILAKIADTTLFLARWNKTPKPIVKSAIKKLQYKDIKLAGALLNCVNLEKLSSYSYGGYSYGKYKDYYQE